MAKKRRKADLPMGIACEGCDLFTELNEMGLCADCQAKLERDLVRARDWEYSALSFALSDAEREDLRLKIIREYGLANELIAATKSKPTKHLQHIQAVEAQSSYSLEDVLNAVESWLSSTPEYIWCDLQEIAEKIHQHFQGFSPKTYGYKTLLRLFQAHPKRFRTTSENPKNKHKRGQVLVRLTKDHTR